MKKNYIFLVVLCFLATSCGQVEIENILRQTVEFEKTNYCYKPNQRDVHIKFQFPVGMELNGNFTKSSWIFWSSEFENVAEAKEYIVENFAQEVDLHFVLYEKDRRNSPLYETSLSYSYTARAWNHQVTGTRVNDPWIFILNYTVPDDVLAAKKTLYGALRIKHEDIQSLDNFAFSDPVVIDYCGCDKQCPSGFTLNMETCECECRKRCPEGYRINDDCECECDRDCPGLATLNKETCECECPDGYVMVEGDCLPIRIPCPKGYVMDPVNGDCVWEAEFLKSNEKIGSLSISTPIKVVVGFENGKPIIGWIYPTTIEDDDAAIMSLTKENEFQFRLCKWTLNPLLNSNSEFYRTSWTPFVGNIVRSLKSKRNESNHFSILLQGSADGGTHCKRVARMDRHEKLIYDRPLFYLNKTIEDKMKAGGQHRYADPVNNEDLPNLRASFLLWNMTRSQISSFLQFGVINGEVIPGRNPRDRKVTIYILQTSFDITQKYPDYFQ